MVQVESEEEEKNEHRAKERRNPQSPSDFLFLRRKKNLERVSEVFSLYCLNE
jgi:hypothetical protein